MLHAEAVSLTVLLVVYLLWWLTRVLARSRSGFGIGLPLAVGFGLRMAAIAGIGLTGLQSTLRGGDESTFLSSASLLAHSPFGFGWWPHGIFQLHVVIFAVEERLGLSMGAMRVVQVGIALTGVVLIVAAVYDLAGARAARFAAWAMMLEPTSLFFNSALHKDPNMELASGLVVFGGTMIWKRLDVRGLLLCGLGGLIAVETRSYAGWFLVSAAVLVLLHAAFRNMSRPSRAMPAIAAVVAVAFLATPTLLAASSHQSLQKNLQGSQNANTTSTQGNGSTNGNNLALETVDFSTRGAVITNLPKRIRDVLLKPYPWQLGDISQRFGALGTLVFYVILFLFLRYAWQSRRHVFARAGPVLYPMFFLLVAYSLAAGNAGTAFRYRTHLATLAIAAVAILREQALLARAARRARDRSSADTIQGTRPVPAYATANPMASRLQTQLQDVLSYQLATAASALVGGGAANRDVALEADFPNRPNAVKLPKWIREAPGLHSRSPSDGRFRAARMRVASVILLLFARHTWRSRRHA